MLASGSFDMTVRLWTIAPSPLPPPPAAAGDGSGPGDGGGGGGGGSLGGGELLRLRRPGPVLAVAFAPDGGTLAAAGAGGRAAAWDCAGRPARLALAMGLHPRLGARSPFAGLEPGVARLIALRLDPLRPPSPPPRRG